MYLFVGGWNSNWLSISHVFDCLTLIEDNYKWIELMIYIRCFALYQKEKYSTRARRMWGLLHQPWEHSGLWHLCSEKCWCITQYICTLSISLDGSFFKGICFSGFISEHFHLGLSTGPHANTKTYVKKDYVT